MSDTHTSTESFEIAIGAFLVIVAAMATSFAAYRLDGLVGVALMLAFLSCVWFVLSRVTSPALRPINSQRLTITELFTLLALSGILYCFTIPAVTSAPRGQPPSAVPQFPSPNTPRVGG